MDKPEKEIYVAYDNGPDEIGFAGRMWVKNIAQPVSVAQWQAMQQRADFHEFNFNEV